MSINCNINGVPRKIDVYASPNQFNALIREILNKAKIVPRIKPKIIEIITNFNVTHIPSKIKGI
jgi:hypothetical protein